MPLEFTGGHQPLVLGTAIAECQELNLVPLQELLSHHFGPQNIFSKENLNFIFAALFGSKR